MSSATAMWKPRGSSEGGLSFAFLEIDEDELDDGLERLEDPDPRRRHRLELGDVPVIEKGVKLRHRGDRAQVPLVVLQDQGDPVAIVPLLPEVDPEVFHGLHVGVHAGQLRIGAEYRAVHPPQDQPAAGVVEHLAGDRVEGEAGLESPDLAERQREKVEEQGPLGLRGQGNHSPPRFRFHPPVDVLKVRRLSAEAGPVVHDFAIDLAGGIVDEGHYSNRLSMSASLISSIPPPSTCSSFSSTSRSILSTSTAALRTRSRTSPTEERRAKITTRMSRLATAGRGMLSRSPSWKRTENSFSPMREASPPVAAMFPAASDASEVVSKSPVSPAEAMREPFFSTRKTTLA